MSDMKKVIEPKSDQLNADDLISGPITVKISGVTIRGGQEQPISVHYDGDNGKPYKPCKSMCRVMVTAWGPDSKQYTGRSMTLYRDPAVKWAGMEVGGIRISHMSDIAETMTMALTVTRSNRKPFTVKPLVSGKPKSAPPPGSSPSAEPAGPSPGQAAGADQIPGDEAIVKDVDHWIAKRKFKAAADVASFIADEALKTSTIEKIEAAYVAAKAGAK